MRRINQKFKFFTITIFFFVVLSFTALLPAQNETAAAQQEPNTSQSSNACTPDASNVLANPSFESGKNDWVFYTNGQGSFTVGGPAYHCSNAAKITITKTNNNMQFYQSDFTLKANTNYKLSFVAKSNSGHDFQLFLQKHTSPYTIYGLKVRSVNLSTSWQTFTYQFTTSGFSGTTADTRLRFWFSGLAQNGDEYWLDDIRLEEVGGSGPAPTATTAGNPTATPGSSSCTPNANNVLNNPGFESGKNNWPFYTNGTGSFTTTGPAYQCNNAAKVSLVKTGNNMQLYQFGFPLKANTNYRLSFAGYSNSGHDVGVILQKHNSPYTNLGLNNANFNLTNSWKKFSVDFTTTGFSGTSSDTRLRFWFVGKAANGDVYWFDDIVLEEIGGAPPPPNPTATPGSPPPPTATPGSGGGGGGKELLVFDWNQPVTTKHHGFPFNQPPIANGNWVTPVNYAQGTLYYRVEIFSQPTAQNMQLQFCFWQEKNGYNFELENCGPTKSVRGAAGTVATWSVPVGDMWKRNGKSIEWNRARFRNGAAIKNSRGLPVSDYNGWKWNGEDPAKWYPLNMRFTVVVVAKGSTFSGWNNYIK